MSWTSTTRASTTSCSTPKRGPPRVQVALATQPETRKYRITVEAQQGVVTLEATAALDQAVEVARTVHGVRDVKTRQVGIPPPAACRSPAPAMSSCWPRLARGRSAPGR